MTRRLIRHGLWLAALSMLASACSGRQTMLDPAADQAAQSDVVWRTMLVVCGVMYVLVMVFLIWALWRARRRLRQDDPPAAGVTEAESGLERGLAGWSALIAAGLVGLSLVSFLADRSLAIVGPKPVMVKITGAQWWWQVDYSDGGPSNHVVTANEVHLPLGRPARLTLVANDVIHSFWVPNLSGKEDLIPGRVNVLTITPRRLGRFRGQCAEFCGLEHARMALEVVVEEPASFEAWKQQQRSPAPPPSTPAAAEGQHVFLRKACAACHRIAGTDAGGATGPDLTHVASRQTLAAGSLPNTPQVMHDWIADPQLLKPGTNMPKVELSPHELAAVVAYLGELK